MPWRTSEAGASTLAVCTELRHSGFAIYTLLEHKPHEISDTESLDIQTARIQLGCLAKASIGNNRLVGAGEPNSAFVWQNDGMKVGLWITCTCDQVDSSA
jgi:hypothetical protein